MKENTLYLKYYDTLVAYLTVEDNLPKSLEIINSNLFFDKFDKVILNEEQTIKWIKSRIRPNSQAGLNKILNHYNIKSEDKLWWWKLFLETKGMNVKDRLYISTTEYGEDNNPWNLIYVEDNNYKGLTINTTTTALNIDGACEKNLYRINGNLAIVKKSLQDNTVDCIAEELAYNIATKLGIKCAPAQYLGNNICYSIIDENIDLIHAEDLFKLDEHNVQRVYESLLKKQVPTSTLIDYLRMVLFDILTIQLDRNMTNFAFYKNNGIIHMYRLYDNGLSLFSATRVNNNFNFIYCGSDATQVLDFVKRQLNRLNVNSLFNGSLDKSYLYDIFNKFAKDYETVRGVKVSEIVDIIYNRYKHIISSTQYTELNSF